MKRSRAGMIATLNVVLILTCAVLGQSDPRPAFSNDGMTSPHDGALKLRGPEQKGPVPKFGIIWQGKLTRSGMPKDADGWKWLRAQGVKTIVNFRARNDVDYKGFGFTGALWIPMDNGRLPTDEEAVTYLQWIQNSSNQPVHIQCAEGKDRTGMMAALARYAIEGWSIEDAIKEASLYRKGEPLADERISWLRDWARRHPPGSYRNR